MESNAFQRSRSAVWTILFESVLLQTMVHLIFCRKSTGKYAKLSNFVYVMMKDGS